MELTVLKTNLNKISSLSRVNKFYFDRLLERSCVIISLKNKSRTCINVEGFKVWTFGIKIYIFLERNFLSTVED